MWNDTELPLGYFITFETYGTWLHGDERGSTSRQRNKYASKFLPPVAEWKVKNEQRLLREPFVLDHAQRACVEAAIKETCTRREWHLYAVNPPTNHVHSVLFAGKTKDTLVLNALKANATRCLREAGLYASTETPWADKGSQRWLWTRKQVDRAVDYVIYGQGDDFLE